jgi:hypothetical protein
VSWSSKRRRLAYIDRQQQLERQRDEPYINHLSDVDCDGKPRHPEPELTPEQVAAWEAWQAWRLTEEGIAAEVAEEIEYQKRQQEWERLHPGEPRPRRSWIQMGLSDQALIRLSLLSEPPPAEPAPDSSPPPIDPPNVLPLPLGLKELSPDGEDCDDD